MKTHTKIQHILLTNQQKNTESIMVFVAALFTYSLLPQLLFRYLYAEQPLTEVPAVLEYIPVITFAVAMLHFFYVVAGTIARNRKVTQLQKAAHDDCGCGGACGDMDDVSMENMLDPEELAELEKIVDEVLDAPKKKKQKTTKASTKTKRVKTKTISSQSTKKTKKRTTAKKK